MSKYVTFLRGINVGGRIIKMTDLKACFNDMGFKGVTTFLQTGNVVFEGNFDDLPQLKRQIETGLNKIFNYPARVQVFSLESLAKIVHKYPFDSSDDSFQHYVIFMENYADDLAIEAIDLDSSTEAVQAGNLVVYWRVKKGMTLKSPFSKQLTKAKYKEFNTVRNIKTLRKII
jgi:uncharacterized protein (DUF1697 family)